MPRIGGVRAIADFVRFAVDPIVSIRAMHERHGPLFALQRPMPGGQGRLNVFATGAVAARRLLGDPATFRTAGLVLRGPDDSAQRRLRAGVVAMNAGKHAYWRKLLLPPLRRPKIDAMVPDIGRIVAAELDQWPRGAADLWPLCQRMMRRISLNLLFHSGGPPEEGEAVAQIINDHVRQSAMKRVLACPVDVKGTPYHAMLRHSEEAERRLLCWAHKARRHKGPDDLLSIVANNPDYRAKGISDAVIAGHIPTLFGASYETCQTALAWTLFLLAQHPAIHAALHDALQDGAAEDGGPLMDWVIKESMRLLTPVPYQIRVAKHDTELLGHPVPRGSRFYLGAFLTNRDPAVYDDPARFRPERWATIDPSPYEYLTFSAGPRTCIGFWFAMRVLRIALAGILRRYRLTVQPGARIDRRVSITMSPRRSLPFDIQPQDRAFRAHPVTGNINDLVATPG